MNCKPLMIYRRLVLSFVVCLLPLLVCVPMARAQENLRLTREARVFKANRDAVVSIATSQVVRRRFGLYRNDPFGGARPQVIEQQVRRTGLGSGFIVHRDGLVVTNAHVVEGADAVEVILADKTRLPAAVLASDVDQDLAILQLTVPGGRELSVVTLGDSSDLMPGEPAISIGNPLGYGHSVTRGIVSALGRDLPIDEHRKMTGLIQVDTPINRGSSGGPLLNAYGQVIGITTAMRADAEQIGFAIPVNRLRDLVPELLDPLALGRVDVGGKLVERRVLNGPNQLQVTLEWHPSDRSQRRIQVHQINGRAVAHVIDAYVELLRLRPGMTMRLSDGRRQVAVTIRKPRLSNPQQLAWHQLGAQFRAVTEQDQQRLKIGNVQGLMIESLDRSGPSAAAGLHAGDVVIQIGRFRVQQPEHLSAVLESVSGGDWLDIYVLRDGKIGRARVQMNDPPLSVKRLRLP